MKTIKINSKLAQLKKCKLVYLLLLFSMAMAHAQSPGIYGEKTVGGTGNDFANSVVQTNDGGFVVAGVTYSTDGDVTGQHGSGDFWVVKLSSQGILQWQNALGGPATDFGWEIEKTADGGFVVVGFAAANGGDVTGNHGNADVWVTKLNANGLLQWQKSLGGSESDRGFSIQQTTDGGYIVAGHTRSNDGDVLGNHGGEDFWIVKLSSSGSIQWEKSLGGTLDESAFGVIQSSDGGYIAVGTTFSNNGNVTGNHGSGDFWVVKMSDSGNLLWQRTYGGSNHDSANSIRQTSDGGYIVAGFTLSNDGDVSSNNGIYDFWVIKIEQNGTLQWQKTFGGSNSDYVHDIQLTPDGGFVVTGETESNNGDVSGNHGLTDHWMARLNSVGELQWQKTLGGSDEEFGGVVQVTSDNGFVMAGTTYSSDGDVSQNSGNGDFWVVKLEQDPLAIEDFQIQKIVLYPNPVSELLHIEAQQDIVNINIFNLLGQELFKQTVDGAQATINMSGLSAGTYLINITSNHGTRTYKIQKQ